MPHKYDFVPYREDWPAAFAREADNLRALLRDELVAVHHIGSTSIPGLAAKPVIDVLPVVRDIAYLDRHCGVLVAAGYTAWGEYGLPRRRYFTRERDGMRTHHAHCYGEGDPEIERHLAFAAYLRAHGAARVEYEALKREAFERHPADIGAYCDFKDSWIKATERRAIEWYRARAVPGTVGESATATCRRRSGRGACVP